MNKKIIAMIVGLAIVIVFIGLVVFGVVGKATTKIDNPIATIKFEGYEEPVIVELYPDQALNTVKNFIALSNGGFYDGLIIHRIEKDFVIQGGDPEGTGSGWPTLSAIDSSIEKGSDADKKYSINRRVYEKWL